MAHQQRCASCRANSSFPGVEGALPLYTTAQKQGTALEEDLRSMQVQGISVVGGCGCQHTVGAEQAFQKYRPGARFMQNACRYTLVGIDMKTRNTGEASKTSSGIPDCYGFDGLMRTQKTMSVVRSSSKVIYPRSASVAYSNQRDTPRDCTVFVADFKHHT